MIYPTQGRRISRFLGTPDDPLSLSRLGRLRAHPVFAPVAWLLCLVLGGLFWLAIGYYVMISF